MLVQLDTENADRDLTSQVTVLTHTPDASNPRWCVGYIAFGDGAKNLDGTGGDFELTVTVGGQTIEPDPQVIAFSTATRCAVWTTPFPVPTNAAVILNVKSPNAGDSDVDVTAYLYDALPQNVSSGIVESNLKQVLGTAPTEGAAGRLAAAMSKQWDVATPVFTAACVNQTIDNPTAAAIGTDAAGKVLVTPAQKLVTDANGYVTYANAAPPTADAIGTDAASKVLATPAQKLVTDANGYVTYANTPGDTAGVTTLLLRVPQVMEFTADGGHQYVKVDVVDWKGSAAQATIGTSTLVATDIVSGGAITTGSGKVTGVGTVDTVTAVTGLTPGNLDATVSSRSTLAAGAAMTLTGDYDAAKTAAQAGDEMDLVDAPNSTAVTAIQAGLSTLTAGGVWSNADRTLTAFGFTPTPSNAADTTAIKGVTDKLLTAIVLDGAVYQFTANALELAPSAGTALTAQQTRDAMKLAPSAGAAATGSIDAVLATLVPGTPVNLQIADTTITITDA
jgi:hypothetical protein